jgi:FkbM family methyltransferase
MVPASIHVTLRIPAEVQLLSPLAKALLASPGGKGRGWVRVRRKTMRWLFYFIHHRLGVPARATMTVDNGTSFEVNCANTGFLDFARSTSFQSPIEPEVTGLLIHLAPRLRVIYDIGANWGYYPVLLGTQEHFVGEIHAFEIRPQTSRDLRHVIASAHLADTVAIHDFGLSRDDGQVPLAKERHSYLSRVVDADHNGPTEIVRVYRLDGLDLPTPDLIKLDVEGHEAAVLSGAFQLLEKSRPLIIFESSYTADHRESMLQPLQFLTQLGYRLYRPTWRPESIIIAPVDITDDRSIVESLKNAPGTIDLTPIETADRAEIGNALNLLAVHPAQHSRLF